MHASSRPLPRSSRSASSQARTLKSYFDNDATIKEIGGTAYLARLAANATTIINAEEYGRTIYELAQRRKLIGIGTDLVNEPSIRTSRRPRRT